MVRLDYFFKIFIIDYLLIYKFLASIKVSTAYSTLISCHFVFYYVALMDWDTGIA